MNKKALILSLALISLLALGSSVFAQEIINPDLGSSPDPVIFETPSSIDPIVGEPASTTPSSEDTSSTTPEEKIEVLAPALKVMSSESKSCTPSSSGEMRDAGNGVDLSSVGSVSWTNTDNIVSLDGNFASAKLRAGDNSHYLVGTNYNFCIPEDATISGIEVTVTRRADRFHSIFGIFGVRDRKVSLIKDSNLVGENKAKNNLWPTSFTSTTYGSSNELWGETWTPADINSGNFGVALAGHSTAIILDKGANIDDLKITVYFAPSHPPILATVTPVVTPTNNVNPDYTFSSNEVGTITYQGDDCTSETSSTVIGNNTIKFNTKVEGLHTCSLVVTDSENFHSEPLEVGEFIIDTVPPVIMIEPYTTATTSEDILVNATTSGDGTLNFDSHLFTENGSFDFVATDEVGNISTSTVTITNIDKTVREKEKIPSSYHSGGTCIVVRWEGNMPICQSLLGQVLGTSTDRFSRSTTTSNLTPEQKKMRELRRKINEQRILAYDREHPTLIAQAIPSTPSNLKGTNTLATTPDKKKPFWMFW